MKPNPIKANTIDTTRRGKMLPSSRSVRAAITNNFASSVPKTSAGRTGFGPAPAAASQCTCAASNSGSKTSTSNSTRRPPSSSTGNAHSATSSTTNQYPNTTATAENISTQNTTETLSHTPAGRYAARRGEPIAHIPVIVYAIQASASLAISKGQ